MTDYPEFGTKERRLAEAMAEALNLPQRVEANGDIQWIRADGAATPYVLLEPAHRPPYGRIWLVLDGDAKVEIGADHGHWRLVPHGRWGHHDVISLVSIITWLSQWLPVDPIGGRATI